MSFTPPRLFVHDNRREFIDAAGRSFFYLADTAWELFHRATREDAELLLSDRVAKRFTVIQAVALAEFDGLDTPNAYGHRPLVDNDPTRPDPDYFEHVDWVVRRANELGLYVGMLPTWGDKFNRAWGVGPEVFTPENARVYGEFLGARYRNSGIIWILGGDRALDGEHHLAIVRAMAEGLERGDGGAHLMGFHPPGGDSSSTFVHAEAWIDFHAIQSGHVRDRDNHAMLDRDRRLLPARPFLDMEPGYEDHPNSFNPEKGWLDQHDVRKSLYWSLFCGAAGYTYGCHDVWQLWTPERTPVNGCHTPWRQALNLPGAGQLQWARRLIESRPSPRDPAPWLLRSDPGQGGDHVAVCRVRQSATVMAYIPSCQRVTLDLERFGASKIVGWWFKPSSGETARIGELPARGQEQFQPPFDPTYRDWVLVLDDAALGLAAPGTI